MDDRAPSARGALAAGLLLVTCLTQPFGRACAASDLDESRVKCEAVLAFAQGPRVTRQGARVTIAF